MNTPKPLVTLTLHLPETSTQGDVYIYKSWDITKSPFWTQYVEGPPCIRTVSYPVLPYPCSYFEHKYLGESLRFDFEAEHFTEGVCRQDLSRREIRVSAKSGSVGIRGSEDGYEESVIVDANFLQYFINEGWILIEQGTVCDEDD